MTWKRSATSLLGTRRKWPQYSLIGYFGRRTDWRSIPAPEGAFLVGSYRVIYRVHRDDDVQLLTVHHGARPLDTAKIEFAS